MQAAVAERMDALRRREPYAWFKAQYQHSPAAFARDCFTWRPCEGPAAYQLDALERLEAHKRLCVRSPHGAGKSALCSWVVLWFALTRDGEDGDWKAPTTASAWRQLTYFLWPEIRKWARRIDWGKVGRPPLNERKELLALNLKLGTGEAFAVASDNPALIEGAHARHLLYLFDEAKAIPAATFDAAEGAFATAGGDTPDEAYALAVSTPGEPVGRFYDIQSRKPGYEDWDARTITLDECMAARRVSAEWVEQRKRQWGESSPVYQNRVAGNFAAAATDSVIPLAWVEAANERWHEWVARGRPGELTALGVDVARGGEDQTAIAHRHGKVISSVQRYAQGDTMETTGRVCQALGERLAPAVVDVIGVGAGVVDRLREMGREVVPFNASEAARDQAGRPIQDRPGELQFANKRSAAWWNLRELLDPANGEDIALPPDDLLTGDLVAPRYRMLSGGAVQVEDKDSIRKRIGRSTDSGDAVVQAFWSEISTGPQPGIYVF